MENLIDRRKFLESSIAWTAISSGLVIPNKNSQTSPDYKSDFIDAARKMGGCGTLGYRLSDPWLGPDGLWNIAYQNGVLQKDIYGSIGLRNILDDLSKMGQDYALGSNRFGIFVPIKRALLDRDYENIPIEINQKVDELTKVGANPGEITSPATDYGAFQIVRFQKMALQRWNSGLVTKILIGNALGPLGIIPPESLLIAARLDSAIDCSGGQSWPGIASYYSVEGCIGCNPGRIMANGEVFRDDGETIAFWGLPLNSQVLVTNTENGAYTIARVTDRGDFWKRGWIADLSPRVRDEIGGSDLTPVEITQLLCS